jgi:hypothetical protein
MLTDAQVRLMRQRRMDGKTQKAAAAAAGMSERSARTWEKGPVPSERKVPRTWRTRPDPFEQVWETDVVPLLVQDEKGQLQATSVLGHLVERRPEQQFDAGQLRTLQRRMREWRALHGPDKEVFFEQVHPPGREAAIDFTHGTELGVTIRGMLLIHLLFEFVLSASGWTWIAVAFGETFEALVGGLQGALWTLGGVPAIVRSDNLSAATHELASGGRELTRRFRAVLDHYDLRSTRIQPGEAHENGVVEQRHYRTKRAIADALLLRGSSDFDSIADYEAFARDVIERTHNRLIGDAVAVERAHLRPLPSKPVPSYTTHRTKVRRWSTIRVGRRTYSVPSRLIGHEVEARQHADEVDVLFRGRLVETMPRLRGEREARIDYRHVIWSLVRKPGAFAAYRYREELFPSLVFRRAYDALRASRGDRADVEYVRVLHLAASTLEADVERALLQCLDAGVPFDYATVRAIASPAPATVPVVAIAPVDLAAYDRLLGGAR